MYLEKIRFVFSKKNVIYFIAVYSAIIELLISAFGLNPMLRYVSDIATILLTISCIKEIINNKNKNTFLFIIIATIFILVFYFSICILQKYNPLHFIWGVRTQFVYIFLLIDIITIFKAKDIKEIFKLIFILFYFHFLISLFEFVIGYNQDINGGIFGVASGCNTGSNILIISTIISSLFLLNIKKIKFITCIINILLACLIAVFGEIKVFYFELIIIVFVYLLFSRVKLKSFCLLLSTVIVLFVALNIISSVYPSISELFDLHNLKLYFDSNRGYTAVGDLNRTGGIKKLTELFFINGSGIDITFYIGIGLGNATHSGITIFNTSFYEMYADLHYSYFLYTYVFLEMGLIGIIYSFLIYLCVFLQYRTRSNLNFIVITCGLSLIFLFFYNSSFVSLQNGYIYLLLLTSIPFIFHKENIYQCSDNMLPISYHVGKVIL